MMTKMALRKKKKETNRKKRKKVNFNSIIMYNVYPPIVFFGSVALPCKMLDLGLLKILGCFFPFLAPAVGFNPAGPYLNLFPNPVGLS